MSDLNDDLLNYELGEFDDHDVNEGDEDDLLLSDEEQQQKEDELLLNESGDEDFDALNKNVEKKPSAKEQKPKETQKQMAEKKQKSTDSTGTTTTTTTTTTTKPVAVESIESSKADSSSVTAKVSTETEVSTTNQLQPKTVAKPARPTLKRNATKLQITKNDEVSSTNKECDLNRQSNEKVVSSVTIEDPVAKKPKENYNNEKPDEKQAQTQEAADSSSCKKDISDDSITQSQQQVLQESIVGKDDSEKRTDLNETEDSDDNNERENPKTSVERGSQDCADDSGRLPQRFPKKMPPGAHPSHHTNPFTVQRPGGHFPGPYNSYPSHPDNGHFNTGYRYSAPGDQPSQSGGHPRPGPPLQSTAMPPRMDYRGSIPFNYPPHYQMRPIPGVPLNPNHPHPIRSGPRPEYAHPTGGPTPYRGPYTSSGPPPPPHPHRGVAIPPPPQLQPQRFDHVRPRMPPRVPGGPPYMAPRALNQQQPYVRGPITHQPPQSHVTGPPSAPLLVPTKVLINPNFKGGVEAATNQLMMEAMSKNQFALSTSDAELLRKQEAFINQNRQQIERRRYERSPDRVRERSYSPTLRRDRERRVYSRERDVRRPYNVQHRGGPGNRGRRAGSRDYTPPSDNRHFPKRRRSSSLDRKNDRKDGKLADEEDEETRSYRLKIEKQKMMREEILRDKEMRRRKAAEEKKEIEEKKPDEPVQKFTPLIVTEKKIISLKKKAESSTTAHRIVPTAKIQPETIKRDTNSGTTMAVVKPVLKQIIVKQPTFDDDLNEDELLADSPSPPQTSKSVMGTAATSSSSSLSPKFQRKLSTITATGSTGPTTAIGTGKSSMFTNRRVILKSSSDLSQPPQVMLRSSKLNDKNVIIDDEDDLLLDDDCKEPTVIRSKGIFDRLERRVAISDLSKRKIQRIVINNVE